MSGEEMTVELGEGGEKAVKEEEEGSGEGASERVRLLFSRVQTSFQQEQETKEKIRCCVRELEQRGREMFTTMQAIHQSQPEEVPAVCQQMRSHYPAITAGFASLKEVMHSQLYYRYHDFWRFVSQRLAFLTSLLVFLESGQLASRSDVASMLGVHSSPDEGFHLDLEDFLMGLLLMASELSRLAVNSVTLGDYRRPFSISLFLSDLSSGFRLLNLKNDFLRKKFDALKYDVKRVEGIVYDVTIRGLKPT